MTTAPVGRRSQPTRALAAIVLAVSSFALGSTVVDGGVLTAAHAATSAPPNTVPPLVEVPADERAHPEVANEWWYTVGHVDSEAGPAYGFEVGLYRFLTDEGFVYRADVAVTDVNSNRFDSSMTFAEATIATGERLDVTIGPASISGSSASDMRVVAKIDDQTAIDFTLRSRRPPLPARAQGFIPFGNGSTYYYSLHEPEGRRPPHRGRGAAGGHRHRVAGPPMGQLDVGQHHRLDRVDAPARRQRADERGKRQGPTAELDRAHERPARAGERHRHHHTHRQVAEPAHGDQLRLRLARA